MRRSFYFLIAGVLIWVLAFLGELITSITVFHSFGPPEVLRCYPFAGLILVPALLSMIPGAVIGVLFLLLPVGEKAGSEGRFVFFISFNLVLVFLFYTGLWVHLDILKGIGLLDWKSVFATALLMVSALFLFLILQKSPLQRIAPRSFVPVCLVLLVLMTILCSILPSRNAKDFPAAENGDRKDILIISLDTVRKDALGCYGNPIFKTPTLDSLARTGVLFTEAVSQSPFTAPSHASLLTSLYPSSHRIRTNGIQLKEGTLTLPALLARYGYGSAAVLSGSSLSHDVCGLNAGFMAYDDVFTSMEGFMRTSLGEFTWRFLKKLAPGSFAVFFRSLQERKASETTDCALRWLRKMDGNVFLWVHYFDPHFTYLPPPPFTDLYDPGFEGIFRPYDYLATPQKIFDNTIGITEREKQHAWALYGGEISYADRELGRLLAELSAMGRLKNMLVVVVADHGEYFGENGSYFMHGGLRREVLNVPLIMVDPNGWLGGTGDGPLAEIVDIMPTILQIVMLPVPQGLEGTSLLSTPEENRFAFSDCGPCGLVSVRSKSSILRMDLESGERTIECLPAATQGDTVVTDSLEDALLTWTERVGLRDVVPLDPEESERLRSLGYIH